MPEMSTGQAIKKALSLCLDNYEEAFLAGEDIGIYGGAFGVTDGLLEQYGENRIKDTPISEDVIAGLGVGAAITGMRPIVEMQFSDFIVNAMDPNCDYEFTSIRPGEKIDEEMISIHDSINTLEFDDHFVVQPIQAFWGNKIGILGGRSCPENFRYASNYNCETLDENELSDLLSDYLP